MFRGMYAAISGLEVHQTMLDVTANNLANVDTMGYKAQRATFVDQLSELVRAASGPNSYISGVNPTQVGLGVQLGSIDNLMGSGSLQSTGNALDVAIEGDGFLRVGGGIPPALPTNVQYTRAGNLTVSPQGYLTTQTGLYVVGFNAVAAGAPPNVTYSPGNTQQYLQIPVGSTAVAIGQDGSVSYIDQNAASPTYQQRVTAGYISLATFPNEAGLQREGGSLWSATANSGAANVGTPSTNGFGLTISGTLEMSNVDLASEFTSMITAQRGYQANSRVITTADQMLQTVVDMKQ
jgi:flagellar hook protein FlgE